MRSEMLQRAPFASPDGAMHERASSENHIIKTRRVPEQFNPRLVDVIESQAEINNYTGDEAGFEGESPKMYSFASGATSAEIGMAIRQSVRDKKGIVAFGAKSSLTGASVPKGEVLLNMQAMTAIGEVREQTDGKKVITVEPGVSFKTLNKHLSKDTLFLPGAPTYDDATVGGGASTNSSGARGYKYGKFGDYVMGLEMVLSTGEVLNIKRNEIFAKKGADGTSYFEIENEAGERRKVPVPTYQIPDVPKVSAGYNNKPNKEGKIDLVDVLVGSEGSLGVITKLDVEVIPEPPTAMALVVCENDEQMHKLMLKLRDQQKELRESKKPGGLSAVEYISAGARNLIAQEGDIKPPGETGNALLLVQMEFPNDDTTAAELFERNCIEAGIDFSAEPPKVIGAAPEDTKGKNGLIALRESVPQTVNRIMRGQGVKKAGSDACVKPELLETMSGIFDEELAGHHIVKWGHGEGNEHVNVLAKTDDERNKGIAGLLKASTRAIQELGGIGTAEHAVGKHPMKQELTRITFGDEGITQMRAMKEAFDPVGVMAPGNIFPLQEAA